MTHDDKKSGEAKKDDFMAFLKKNREDIQQNWPEWKANAFKVVRQDSGERETNRPATSADEKKNFR